MNQLIYRDGRAMPLASVAAWEEKRERVGLQNRDGPSPEFHAIAPADYIFELRVADLTEGIGDTSDVAAVRVRDRNGREAETPRLTWSPRWR